MKNDERDAEDLVDLLRLGRLSESWISPPEVRDLRELVRYRLKLRQMRSGLRCQVHQVLAKEGIHVPVTDLFGKAGRTFLDRLFLEGAYKRRVESARDLLLWLRRRDRDPRRDHREATARSCRLPGDPADPGHRTGARGCLRRRDRRRTPVRRRPSPRLVGRPHGATPRIRV